MPFGAVFVAKFDLNCLATSVKRNPKVCFNFYKPCNVYYCFRLYHAISAAVSPPSDDELGGHAICEIMQ